MIPMKMDEDEADIGDHFTMNESCWDAVKTAVANKIALKREANIKELELPSEESAGIIQGHTIDLYSTWLIVAWVYKAGIISY